MDTQLTDLWRFLRPTLTQGLIVQAVSGTSGRLVLRFYASPQLQKYASIEVDNADRGYILAERLGARSKSEQSFTGLVVPNLQGQCWIFVFTLAFSFFQVANASCSCHTGRTSFSCTRP
jgi:hypothetical protein